MKRRRLRQAWRRLQHKFAYHAGIHYCLLHSGVRNEDDSGPCDFSTYHQVEGQECVFIDAYVPGPWVQRWFR